MRRPSPDITVDWLLATLMFVPVVAVMLIVWALACIASFVAIIPLSANLFFSVASGVYRADYMESAEEDQ